MTADTSEPRLHAARRQRALRGVTGAALITVLGATLTIGSLDIRPDPLFALIATLALFGSLIARYRIRLDGEYGYIGWTEVGVATCLCLVPPVWTPVLALVAAVLA